MNISLWTIVIKGLWVIMFMRGSFIRSMIHGSTAVYFRCTLCNTVYVRLFDVRIVFVQAPRCIIFLVRCKCWRVNARICRKRRKYSNENKMGIRVFGKESGVSRRLVRRYVSAKTARLLDSEKRRSRSVRLAFRERAAGEFGAEVRAKRTRS